MASLKNMMNVQVKLEPLPNSILQQAHGTINLANGAGPPLVPLPQPKATESKKKGRPKKRPADQLLGDPDAVKDEMKHEPILTIPTVPTMIPTNPNEMPVKKKRDRFNGMTEDEVLKRTLPDHLTYGLDIAIVGINPGLTAAYVGHHYAGPGNHFWKCLFLSGLIPEPMKAYDDYKLKDYGIGFTNIVERTSRGSADLTKKEIQEGGQILKGKIKKYKPKIVVFNGKGIFEVFCGHKKFSFGKQPVHFPECEESLMFVMPSSSARCTQLPRAVDKVPFYAALRKLRDYLRGDLKELEESEITFPDVELKTAVKPDSVKKEKNGEGKKARKQAAASGALTTEQQAMIQQAAQQVKMEGGLMPPPQSTGGPMGPGMFPLQPQLAQPQSQPEQPQPQPLSSTDHNNPVPYGMPQNTSWNHSNMMGPNSIKPDPGLVHGPNAHGQGQFYPHHWSGGPPPAHSHQGNPAMQPPQHPQQTQGMQQSQPPSWSPGAPPMPGGSMWMQPHNPYMKPHMPGNQPPPYPYSGHPQYGGAGPGHQGQPFPFSNPNFQTHMMQKPDDQGQNRGFGVKEEPRWQ